MAGTLELVVMGFIVAVVFLQPEFGISVLHKKYSRLRNYSKMKLIPKVPSIVYPPVPDEVRLSLDEIQALQERGQDPETRAGLFQGDMALTNEVSPVSKCDVLLLKFLL